MDCVLQVLHTSSGALLASELLAACQKQGVSPERARTAIRALERRRRALVVTHTAPDRHLAGDDLRVVAAVDGSAERGQATAADAVRRRWTAFLRTFLSTHRCR